MMPLYLPQHTPTWKQGYAHNAAEAANPGLWKMLVGAWYPSLGPSGNTLRDISGRGNHGPLDNMDPATDWQTYRNGYFLDFDRTQYIDLGNSAALQLELPITIAGWVRVDANEASTSLLATDDFGGPSAAYYGAHLAMPSTTSFELNVGDGSGTGSSARRSKTSGTLPSYAGQWSHFGGVIRGLADMSTYFNGVEVNAGLGHSGSGSGIAYSASSATIGTRNTTDGFNQLDGGISNVEFWGRALSASEIRQLYQDQHATVRQRAVWVPNTVVAAPAGGTINRILGGGIL